MYTAIGGDSAIPLSGECAGNTSSKILYFNLFGLWGRLLYDLRRLPMDNSSSPDNELWEHGLRLSVETLKVSVLSSEHISSDVLSAR